MRNLSNMKNNDIGSVLNTNTKKIEQENKVEVNYSKNSMQNMDIMELK